jgi:hypothetical protein
MRFTYGRLDLFGMRTANRLVEAMQRGNRRWPWLGKSLVGALAVAVVVAFPFEAAVEALQWDGGGGEGDAAEAPLPPGGRV